MYAITVNVGNVSWQLLFRDQERFNSSLQALTLSDPISTLTLADDFGQTTEFKRSSLHGFFAEDLDQSRLAHIEMGLHRHKTQMDFQKRAGADPGLRQPAVLQPMPGGNGMFRSQ